MSRGEDIQWANIASPHTVYVDRQSGGEVDAREVLAHKEGVKPDELPKAQYAERGVRKDGVEYTKTKQRDPITIEVRRAQIAALYAQDDMTLQKIADHLTDVTGERWTKMNVHHHVQRLIHFWREKGLAHIDEKKAYVLARLDQVEMLALDCFFDALGGKVITNEQFETELKRIKVEKEVEEALDDGFQTGTRGQILKRPKKSEEEDDDPFMRLIPVSQTQKRSERREPATNADKWLRIVIDVNKERAKLWGLYVQVSSDPDADFAKLSDEDKEVRMAAILEKAAKRRQLALTEGNGGGPTTIDAEWQPVKDEPVGVPLSMYDTVAAQDIPSLDEGWE